MNQSTMLLATVPPETLRLVTGDPSGAAFPWMWLIAGVVVASVVGVAAVRVWLGFLERNAHALAFASVCRSAGVSRHERAALRSLAAAHGCSPLAMWLSDHARAEFEGLGAKGPSVPQRPNPRTNAVPKPAARGR